MQVKYGTKASAKKPSVARIAFTSYRLSVSEDAYNCGHEDKHKLEF